MVSLVLVAHSAQLAEGARELAQQMAQGKVAIAAAGGSQDPENPLGTSVALISSAIQSVFSQDGVLVLTDLGSALLSSETAIELLPSSLRSKVRLSACPLVEGAVSAAVQAALGSPIDDVEAEAVRALAPKIQHVAETQRQGPRPGTEPPPPLDETRVTVPNPLGLHARPAALFVATAGQFPAEIRVKNLTRGRGPANAKSINQLATLEVHQGDTLAIQAQGPQAAEAIAHLKLLVEGGLGEQGLSPTWSSGSRPRPPFKAREAGLNRMWGIPASPGIALGAAQLYARAALPVEPGPPGLPQLETHNLEQALQTARREIQEMQGRVLQVSGSAEAAIFDAHRLYLEDPELVGKARRLIVEGNMTAASAWSQAVQQVVQMYESLEDPSLRARSADIVDVGRRVATLLSGTKSTPQAGPAGPVILIAADLTPSDVAALDRQFVRGICTVLGGANSHAAILARSMNLPAVVGLGLVLLSLPSGTMLALDGNRGEVEINPMPESLETWQRRAAQEKEVARQADAKRQEPALTRDGRRLSVLANAGSLAEVEEGFRQGAEGIGVLRTEFLFLGRSTAPGEEDQTATYRAVLQRAAGCPVVIRTLDAGGDKPLPYLDLPAEANPFLGRRGLRLSLEFPELFKTQLRALLRAGVGHDLRILFPMVTSLEEVRQAKGLVDQARGELAARKAATMGRLPLGIMVEVPAAALLTDQLAREIDFISIGTNDLAQYVLAAERGNPEVARLGDACRPALLRLIRSVVEQSHATSIPVAVCGEMAGDPEAQPLLIGLGIDELSMGPASIAKAKALIRTKSWEECRALAEAALSQVSAGGVRELVRRSARLSPPAAEGR